MKHEHRFWHQMSSFKDSKREFSLVNSLSNEFLAATYLSHSLGLKNIKLIEMQFSLIFASVQGTDKEIQKSFLEV